MHREFMCQENVLGKDINLSFTITFRFGLYDSEVSFQFSFQDRDK